MTDAANDIATIRNLGPAMAEAFGKVGLTRADSLRALGADAAYARLLAGGHKPHFIAYYALVMGLQGRPWNDAKGPEKTALRARFDALVAEARATAPSDSALDRALSEIGVIAKDPR